MYNTNNNESVGDKMSVLTSGCKIGFAIKSDSYDTFVKDKNKLSKPLIKKNEELLSKFSKQVKKD